MNQVPAIIDIEASGFGRGSYPIEVGIALENGEVHSFLIKPAQGWTHWNAEAEKVHGISRQRLMEEGEPAHTIALQLNELLRGMTLYSDAWGFDSSWIARLFDEAGFVQRFKVESINKLFNEEQMEHWNRIKDQVWTEHGSTHRHRAAQDVSVIQETFNRVTQIN